MRIDFRNIFSECLFFILAFTFLIFGESQFKTKEQIDSLKKIIIPSKETTIEQVDNVYGQHSINESCGKVPCNDSAKVKFTLYKWQLLEAKDGQPFRAFLYIKFKNNEFLYSGINHICVGKNKKKCPKESECWKKQQSEIQQEKISILEDLNDISIKFEKKLKSASWNKANGIN